jgi:uncharacterized membrane protein YbhN (UPF0104 family)
MSADAARSSSRTKLWNLIKILFALGIFAYVISKTEYEQLLALKDRFSWGWLLLTLLAFLAMLAIKTLQYYIFIDKKLSYLRTMEVVVVQNVLMSFVATAAGVASYLTMLGLEEDVRLGKATESFVLVKIGDILAVLSFLFVSAFFVQPIPPQLRVLVNTVLVFAVIFFLALLSLLFFRGVFIATIKKIVYILKLGKLKILQNILTYLDEIASFSKVQIAKTLLLTGMISFLYIGLSMFWGYSRFQVFSFSIDIFIFVFIYAFLQLASWVPIYILGGLGVAEGMFLYLLGAFDIYGAELAAVLIGIRVVIYILNALPILYLPLKSIFMRSQE